MPGVDEAGALFEGVRAERLDVELRRCRRAHRREPEMKKPAGCRLISPLGELDAVGSRTLLAWLDFEADALAARQGVEIHARVEAGTVEEVLPSVLGGDEAEPSVGDQLLDGACRHLPYSSSRKSATNARVLSRRYRPRRTSPDIRATKLH